VAALPGDGNLTTATTKRSIMGVGSHGILDNEEPPDFEDTGLYRLFEVITMEDVPGG
jgi:hypothetical protein